MENEMVKKEPSVPGIGMSGLVMCPFGLAKAQCIKNGCELWLELTMNNGTENEQIVGRCSVAWQPFLQIETRQAVDRLINIINKFSNKGVENDNK